MCRPHVSGVLYRVTAGWPALALATCQLVLGVRVLSRLWRGCRGGPIEESSGGPGAERVSVIVPVLNERPRLAPCLEGLIEQGPEVVEILVVDGGSDDGTQGLVRSFGLRDARVALVDASPVPQTWNGKVWGLQVGLAHSSARAGWVLTIDADVRPSPLLVRSILARALRADLTACSLATLQDLGDPLEALLHPAMLTTLVYRFGPPGQVPKKVGQVQANGQCFLARRSSLGRHECFAVARASRCEDVTVARALVAAGCNIGFYEAGHLATVRMYRGWREVWRNWPRSLPMRDSFCRYGWLLGLAEVTFVQALPVPLLVGCSLSRARPRRLLIALNVLLALQRLGVLAGTARAYRRRPWTYWLSPLCDLPVSVALWHSVAARRHVWRGRVLVPGGVA